MGVGLDKECDRKKEVTVTRGIPMYWEQLWQKDLSFYKRNDARTINLPIGLSISMLTKMEIAKSVITASCL